MAEYFDPNKPNFNQRAADEELERQALIAKYGPRSREILDQLARAKTLRSTPMPEGRNPTSRVFKAAHPLEFLNAAYRQYQGEQDVKKGYGAQNAYTQELVKGLLDQVGQFRLRRSEDEEMGNLRTRQQRNAALPTDQGSAADQMYYNNPDEEMQPPI